MLTYREDAPDTIPVLPHRFTEEDVIRFREHQGADWQDAVSDYESVEARDRAGLGLVLLLLSVSIVAAIVVSVWRLA